MIPKDITLIIDNGDRWFCVYDHISCQILGLEIFMEFYGVTMFWFLVMTYSGNDEFGVNIFSPRCCEIFYPSVLHTNVKTEDEFVNDVEVPIDESITEEKDRALFFSNASWSDFSFFKLMIQPIHLIKEYDKVVCNLNLFNYKSFSGWNMTIIVIYFLV